MTNSQKFVYELYDKHKDKILLYLRLCAAKRKYGNYRHKGVWSFHTYKQMDNHNELIMEVESELISNRISLQRLQKINRLIKKVEQCVEIEIESLDYITDFIFHLYISEDKSVLLKEVNPDSNDMRRIAEFKSFKRHCAQKNLDHRIQARIVARRLMKLYYALNPKGEDCDKFVNYIIDETKIHPKVLDGYIAIAKAKNPNFKF